MPDFSKEDLERAVLAALESVQRPGRAPTAFGPWAASYLAIKLANPTLRAATRSAFRGRVLKHLIPAFGALELKEVTNAAFLRWVSETKELTRFFNFRKDLIEILGAARNEGLIDRLPKFDNPDEPKDVGRVLEDREVLAIIWRARRPFRAIFYAFWKMGCRPREILQWEWSMIRWKEPGHTWIDIPARISKTGRVRSIPINPALSSLLYRRYFGRDPGRFVFPKEGDPGSPQLSYHSAWGRACRLAQVSAVAYDLRRTFITRCAVNGDPLIYVAKALDTSTKMIEGTYAKARSEVMEKILK